MEIPQHARILVFQHYYCKPELKNPLVNILEFQDQTSRSYGHPSTMRYSMNTPFHNPDPLYPLGNKSLLSAPHFQECPIPLNINVTTRIILLPSPIVRSPQRRTDANQPLGQFKLVGNSIHEYSLFLGLRLLFITPAVTCTRDAIFFRGEVY